MSIINMVRKQPRRRDFIKTTGGAIGAGLLAGCLGGGNGEYQTNLGTASDGGAMQIIGSGLAEIWNGNENLEINAVSTSGMLENVSSIQKDEIGLGLIDGATITRGYRGEMPFEDLGETDMTTAFRMFTNPCWYFTRASEDDIQTFTDLDGRTIFGGPSGSTQNLHNEVFTEVAGIDVTLRNMGYNEGATAIKNGNIDGYLVYGVLPAVVQLAQQTDLKVIPYGEDVLGKFEELPWTISGMTVPFDNVQGSDTPIVGLDIYTVADPGAPEDGVYNVVQETFENIDAARETHVLTKGLTLEKSPRNVGDLVDIHPGAEQYYDEEGVL
jgi:TRAP transporter TAXI family solute receptor